MTTWLNTTQQIPPLLDADKEALTAARESLSAEKSVLLKEKSALEHVVDEKAKRLHRVEAELKLQKAENEETAATFEDLSTKVMELLLEKREEEEKNRILEARLRMLDY